MSKAVLHPQDFSWVPFLITFPFTERIGAAASPSLDGLGMYMVESKAGAVACMLLSLFFLGTWPAIFTHLERRGRLPQHTYLDYTLTNFLAAVVIAFTLGEIGKGTPTEPNFLDQLFQASFSS
ncbi:hypothetical protein CDL15_Pgr009537 [Punica granatum]|uniref:Ureide permease 1-like n=1 Tax=Punica granatum TaxID=22663 RepID=A0A218WTC4_PUNGR|nr:hypothetical protein CDL15_Pgr009537 [Punica granatum]